MPTALADILQTAINHNASDIHLSVGTPPRLRILGDLLPIAGAPTIDTYEIDSYRTVLSTTNISTSTVPSPPDFSYTDPLTSRRFRINAYTTQRGPSLAMRLIPEAIPSLTEISAPAILTTLALRPRGLVIVTGPTGSGKSATLAAMVDHINRTRLAHILTLEDPIEYLHQDIHCLVSQREIHRHARGYQAALKDAMREDPDVIQVGEMRDPDTIRLALTAAETGHLVLATLHTISAPKSIDRIIDVFPAGEKEMVRTMLAESLQGIVAQQLVRHRSGDRRLAVFETMLCTPGIRNCIKESQTGQIRGLMSTGAATGMTTLDQALATKLTAGEITRDEALRVAHDPAQF